MPGPTTLVLIAVVVAIALLVFARRVTIYEYERGLKYRRGKFIRLLAPGAHWYVRSITTIARVDIRPRFVSVKGQEVLSSDGVALKVSAAASFDIADPNVAVNKVQDYSSALYLHLQLALREIIGSQPIDGVLEKRDEMGGRLMKLVRPEAEAIGLRLLSVDVKDIMFPGQLKQMFAQVVAARRQGLAALEKARGETAALRSLANAARMVEKNPALMQLRLLQSMGEARGNTLIVGMPSQSTPVPIRTQEMESATEGELPEPRGEGAEQGE